MKSFGKILIYLLLSGIIVISSELYSYPTDKFNLGIFAGINNNKHLADFVSIPNYTNQFSPYNNANLIGTSFGITGEYYLLSFLGFGTNITYNSFGATLSSDEFIGNQEIDGNIFPVYTHHSLDTKLSAINFQPNIRIRPFLKLPLSLNIGFSYGLMIKRSFVQTETLSKEAIDNGYRFIDKYGNLATERQKGSGNLPYTFDYRGIFCGIHYLYNLNNNYRIGIEAAYYQNIQEIVKYTGWKVNQMGINLSFLYNLQAESIIEEKPDKIILPEKIIDTNKKQPIVVNSQLPVDSGKSIVVSQQSSGKSEPLTANQQQNLNNNKEIQISESKIQNSDWHCCYLILFSSESKKMSEKVASLAKKAGINNIYVKNWYDNEDNTNYYRVQTDCISSIETILALKNQLNNSPVNLRNIISPVMKCE